MSGAPAVILGRCNPYGAETGGPKRVLGGLYGAASARTEGMHLPENVAQGEWVCHNPATVRCRMICRCQHRGNVIDLCSWHDEITYRGDFVAGITRQISETVKVRGHFEEIQRRQSGSCPACLFPGDFAALAREIMGWQATLTNYWIAGPREWRTPHAQSLRQQIDDAGKKMDEARARGIIHNCPLTLVPVS